MCACVRVCACVRACVCVCVCACVCVCVCKSILPLALAGHCIFHEPSTERVCITHNHRHVMPSLLIKTSKIVYIYISTDSRAQYRIGFMRSVNKGVVVLETVP